MGPYGTDGVAEDDAPGWWWQVLSGWSRAPVIGSGGSDREMGARALVEAQMAAAEAALLGMIVGPRGQVARCLRTTSGGVRWLSAE